MNSQIVKPDNRGSAKSKVFITLTGLIVTAVIAVQQLLLPALERKKILACQNNLRSLDMAKEQWALER